MFRNVRVWLLCLLLLILFVGGCEPREEAVDGSPSQSPSSVTSKSSPPDKSVLSEVSARIAEGDFDSAGRILATLEANDNETLAELADIVAEYDRIELQRAELKKQAYQERIDELADLRKEINDAGIVDVNDIGKVLAVIIKTKEYASAEQIRLLMKDDLVTRVVAAAKEKGDAFEAEGKWIDAYAYCYYWLTTLDEDNAEYKGHAKALVEKASIELSLKDDSCGDTSPQRHEGINANMFIRAIGALDHYYVGEPDYNDMTTAALKRCRLLAEVLKSGKGDLSYSIGPDECDKWLAGVDAIEKDLVDTLKTISKKKLQMIFDEVLTLNTVTLGLPREVVVAQFAESALASLDPFTMLIWPWQVLDFQKNLTQQFTGIGVEISKATGVLKVTSLLPDTPAYRSGLDAEDTIIAVNDEPTEEMTIFCAVSKITGPKGTKVTLTVKHATTDKVEDITIIRDRIIVPPIRGWQRQNGGTWRYMIDQQRGIGYMRVTGFTENTVHDAHSILKQLEKEGLNGLIMDLRFNSGGYLVSASGLVDLFVKEGVIVTSQPRPGRGFAGVEKAKTSGTHPDYPIVVLINGQSASASEIVAGALQDEKFKRAILVGERSYGKGSVQIVVPYSGGGSQLKYTMAYYHLPSGQRVKNRHVMEKQNRKDWGITPDVEVKLRLNELRNMIDIQRENEVLAKADHDQQANPVKRHSVEETLESDPQLSTAILILRAMIIQGQAGI